MKTNSKQQNRSYALGVLLLLMTIIMVGCVYLDSINLNQGTEEEPIYWVKAGEVATFTVKGHIDAAGGETKRFLVAILVPKSWNARENTTVTYIADGVEDGVTSLPMSPVDTKLVPKNATVPWAELLMAEYGVSTNVLNDMEWVAFRTDKIYSIKQHDKASFTITLRCKTGPKNLRFKPAFFINFAEDDFPQKEEYKKYSPENEEKNWFSGGKYKGKTIMKFRYSKVMRCFGYRKGDRFRILRIERDHKISDNG